MAPIDEYGSSSTGFLSDRAAISALLIDFALHIDRRDWDGYAGNYAEDAVLELPWGRVEGRNAIRAQVEADLSRFDATVHYSSNHVIDIDGDSARTRSSLLAIHIPDASQPSRHADVGGWYDCELRRTAEGWKFSRVLVNAVWTGGVPFNEIGERSTP